MTHVHLTADVVRAFGLSVALMGIILSILVIWFSFFLSKILTKKNKGEKNMMVLIFVWAIFLLLNYQSSASPTYSPIFLIYSLSHLFAIVTGIFTFILFILFFKKLEKTFNKKLLLIAGAFAVTSILMRILFPLFRDVYLAALLRIFTIIPPILGFFMIIKSYIGKNE